MLIWLIRHGLTELGAQKRYQGAIDTSLSGEGRNALHPAVFAPERVYVSPMLRARETASILFSAAEHIVVSDLREMDFGAFEGRGWWEMEKDGGYRAWVDGGCWGRCPGGEDREGFSRRVQTAFREIVDHALSEGRERLVIVAHGGTQMAALERWGHPAREYYAWQTAPGAGVVLDAAQWPERLDVVEEVDFTK